MLQTLLWDALIVCGIVGVGAFFCGVVLPRIEDHAEDSESGEG